MIRKQYVISKPTCFHLATTYFHNQTGVLYDNLPVKIVESIAGVESSRLIA